MSSNEAKPEPHELTERQSLILEKLGELALPHVEDSNGKLALLPPDVSQLGHHYEGSPMRPQHIEGVASMVNPDYPDIQQATDAAADKVPHLLPVTRELLKGGNNLLLYTNHGELTDVAFIFAAFCSYAAKRGYEDIYNNYLRGIIVSQIVRPIGIRGNAESDPAPAVPTLGYLCHDVWTSYPIADSMREARTLWRDEIRSNNRKVRHGIDKRLEDGGYVMAMAPSGRKDRPDANQNGAITLHDVAMPTANMMASSRTYALGIAVWLQGKQPIVEFSGYKGSGTRAIPERLQTTDEVNDAMASMAETLNEAVPDREFVYKPRSRPERTTLQRAVDRVREY